MMPEQPIDYVMFREQYPKLILRVVKPDGSPLEEPRP